MALRVYQASARLGAISHSQLGLAFGRLGLGRPTAAEPVPFGLFGQNLFVTTTAGEFVFRGAPLTPWQFPTERFFSRLLHEETSVPAPWPYLIDESCEFFPWSYAVMPRMPGIQAADPAVRAKLTKSDRFEMARAMGRNLALMQTLSAPVCGRFDPVLDVVRAVPLSDEAAWPFHTAYGEVSAAPSHAEIVTARLRRLLERARAEGDATSQTDVDWTADIIAQGLPAISEPLTPRLVMEDYKEGNVVFRRGAGGWEVSGVFDLMGCYFGGAEADLSRAAAEYFDEAPELAGEFIGTYLRSRPPPRGFGARFPVYMLLDRLIIWDYVQFHELELARNLGGLRRWAERYTRIAQALALGDR